MMHRYKFLAKSMMGVLFLGLLVTPLFATTITVTQRVDSTIGSLRNSVAIAQAGDTIIFGIRGEIIVKDVIPFDKSLTLIGSPAMDITISGDNKTQIFQIDTFQVVSISYLNFTRGNAVAHVLLALQGGGAILNLGKVRIKNCVFKDNIAGYGGAIDNRGFRRNSELFLTNCSFINNSAANPAPNIGDISKSGGAIYSDGSNGGRAKILAINCTFSGNRAMDGGGAIAILNDEGDTTRHLFLVHCTLAYNEARSAGAVHSGRYGRSWYKNTILAGNMGNGINPEIFGIHKSEGGLLIETFIYDTLTTVVNVRGPRDTFNVDPLLSPLADYGSGIPVHTLRCGSVAIDRAVASSRTTDAGGGSIIGLPDLGSKERNESIDTDVNKIEDYGGGSLRLAITNLCPGDTLDLRSFRGTMRLEAEIVLDKDITILGNPQHAVRIHAIDSSRIFLIEDSVKVEISHISLSGGHPDVFGGGAILNRGGELSMHACTIYDNRATSGGAIANYGDGGEATLNMTNCTISGNEAEDLDGGAIDNYEFDFPAYTHLLYCTITDNQAAKRGGGLYSKNSDQIDIRNTLVAGNQAPDGPDADGTLNSKGHNLIGDDTDLILTGSNNDILNQAALLGQLGWYGGHAQTHRLLAGSPAIDAGDDTQIPVTDQRGFARKFGSASDIGAYEYDPATAIGRLKEKELLACYPNPTRGSDISVKLPIANSAETQVELFNMSGQLLGSFSFLSSTISLSTRSLQAGIYTLRLRQNAKMYWVKFVRVD